MKDYLVKFKLESKFELNDFIKLSEDVTSKSMNEWKGSESIGLKMRTWYLACHEAIGSEKSNLLTQGNISIYI